MLNRIIDLSINNRLLVLVALLMLSAAAFIVVPQLKLDAFPDVTNVQVVVNTEAPGLAAEEVEQLISYPIEAVMYALPDVSEVRSISKTGLSSVTIAFKQNVDIYFARELVYQRLQTARELIPEGAGVPTTGPNTSGLGQVYQYLLTADSNSEYDAMSLRSLNDWLVKLLLMPIDGVTEVLSFGGEVKQYQVNLNPARLLAYQLTQDDVVSALKNNNTNVGGWYLNRGAEQLVIRGMGWLDHAEKGIEQIKQIPLKTINGAVVTVEQVANVRLGSEIRQGAVTMTRRTQSGEIENLGEVVSGIILKRMGSNTKETIDGINRKIELINHALPDGVKFEVFYNQSDLISKAISTVVNALSLAFIFIVLVLAMFLMNLRATLLVLISIPVSISMALMLMVWFDLSANLMSLGGLAVAIGMLVDGSVVMVEHAIKRFENEQSDYLSILKRSSRAVARPIFFATLIILVVFIPLYSFEGVEARLFEPMATSIILAIMSALLVAIIMVPALAAFLFKRGVKVKHNYLLASLEKVYSCLLKWSMNQRIILTSTSFAIFMLSLSLIPSIGTEFVPQLEEGTINLRVTLAPSSSLETALAVSPRLEKILMEFPEVTYALSRIGRAEIGGDPEPVNNIEIYIGLKPQQQWTSASNRMQLQALMESRLAEHPGLLFNFSQPIATRVDELLSGVKAQLAIKLLGSDLQVLENKGLEIEALVKSIKGTKDVAMEQINGEAQLVVTPDRQQLSRYGLSVSDVMKVVSDGLGGRQAGQIIHGNERYDIYVRLEQRFRNDKEKIAEIRIQSPTGAWVRLGDVANISIQSGPPQIRRDDVQRRVVVQANIQGRDMGNVVTDIQSGINQSIHLPVGYSVEIGGQYESQQRAQKRLLVVVPFSILLIALFLYLSFNSLSQAMLILINIPLAIIGGVFALYFSQQYFSVSSSVGFITLFGVAVLNGVVMVESINTRIRDGVVLEQAIMSGAVSRLRPVLMTALTSALGLIPMLMSTGVGSEIQKPLATVIVGGLITSTLLTLLIIPALYSLFYRQN